MEDMDKEIHDIEKYAKKNIFRFRNLFLVVGTLLVLTLWVLADPDLGIIQGLRIGSSTIATLLFMTKGILAIGILYICTKGMMDYPISDFEKLGMRAVKSPEGAGLYSIAVAIKTLAFALIIGFAFLS